MSFVLDASALVKTVLRETRSDEVLAWFERHADEEFIAPHLLFSEVGRVVQKNLPTSSQREVHARLLSGVRLVEVDEGVWEDETRVTFYDAHYIHLARRLGAQLVTTDVKMAEAARASGVRVANLAA